MHNNNLHKTILLIAYVFQCLLSEFHIMINVTSSAALWEKYNFDKFVHEKILFRSRASKFDFYIIDMYRKNIQCYRRFRMFHLKLSLVLVLNHSGTILWKCNFPLFFDKFKCLMCKLRWQKYIFSVFLNSEYLWSICLCQIETNVLNSNSRC